MSHPSPERDERVEEIRQRHLRVDCYKSQMRADIDYLLSLLDRQAVEHQQVLSRIREEIRQRERDCADEIEQLESGAVNTATRMRDRCVAKVRELRDNWGEGLQHEEDFDWRVDTATKIITVLESLTLEQGEQEK